MRQFIWCSKFICFYSHFYTLFQLLRCICVQVNKDNINRYRTNKTCLLNWMLLRSRNFFHESNSLKNKKKTAPNILYVMWRCCLATWHPVCVQSMLMSGVAGVSSDPPEQSCGLCNICNENAETMTFPCTALRWILQCCIIFKAVGPLFYTVAF